MLSDNLVYLYKTFPFVSVTSVTRGDGSEEGELQETPGTAGHSHSNSLEMSGQPGF